MASRPKILLGCSDITSLLTAITDRTGLVTFHGPMVAKDIAGETLERSSWSNALKGAANWSIPTAGVETLRAGKAEGRRGTQGEERDREDAEEVTADCVFI